MKCKNKNIYSGTDPGVKTNLLLRAKTDFNALNKPTLAGIASTVGNAVGLAGKAVIGGGYNSGVGNGVANVGGAVGGIVSNFNPVLGGVISAASGVIGGVTNRLFGTKVNDALLSLATGAINSLNNYLSTANSFDDMQRLNVATNVAGTYKTGLLRGKSKELTDLENQMRAAQSWADRSYGLNAENILDDLMRTMMESYQGANGGLLNKGAFSKRYAFGGNVSTANLSTGLIHVDNGGTHEENPNEGVPMGRDALGIPNLVEEGEVIYNDYVFSNRLTIPEVVQLDGVELTREEKILKRYAGKTYAEAAKKAEHTTGVDERPNDPISKRGFDSILQVLAESQEEERANSKRKERLAEQQALEELLANLSPELQEALAQLVYAELMLQQLPSLEELLAQQLMAEQLNALQMSPEEAMAIQLSLMAQPLMLELMMQPQQPMACGGNLHAEGGPVEISDTSKAGVLARMKAARTPVKIPTKNIKEKVKGEFKEGNFNGSGSGGRFDLGDYSKHKTFNEAFDAARADLKARGLNEDEGIFIYGKNTYNTRKETNPLLEINNRQVGASDARYNNPEGEYSRTLNPIDVPGAVHTVDYRTPAPNATFAGKYAEGGSLEELQLVEQQEEPLQAQQAELSEQTLMQKSAEEMSTKELNQTIDLIIEYAKSINDRGLLREAKRAKKASREDKELFVDEALEEMREELENQQSVEQQQADLIAQEQQMQQEQQAMQLQQQEEALAQLLAMMQQQLMMQEQLLTPEQQALLEAEQLMQMACGGHLKADGGLINILADGTEGSTEEEEEDVYTPSDKRKEKNKKKLIEYYKSKGIDVNKLNKEGLANFNKDLEKINSTPDGLQLLKDKDESLFISQFTDRNSKNLDKFNTASIQEYRRQYILDNNIKALEDYDADYKSKVSNPILDNGVIWNEQKQSYTDFNGNPLNLDLIRSHAALNNSLTSSRDWSKYGYYDKEGNFTSVDGFPINENPLGLGNTSNRFKALNDWFKKSSWKGDSEGYQNTDAYLDYYLDLLDAIKDGDKAALQRLYDIGNISQSSRDPVGNRYFNDNADRDNLSIDDIRKNNGQYVLENEYFNRDPNITRELFKLRLRDTRSTYPSLVKDNPNALLWLAMFDDNPALNLLVAPMLHTGEMYALVDDNNNFILDNNGNRMYVNPELLGTNYQLTDFLELGQSHNGITLNTRGVKANPQNMNGISLDGKSYINLTDEQLKDLGAIKADDLSIYPTLDDSPFGVKRNVTWYDLPEGVSPLDVNALREKAAKVNREKNPNDYPEVPLWPHLANIGILGALTAYNMATKPDYRHADAILNAAQNAGQYMPVLAEPLGDYVKYQPFDINYTANQLRASEQANARAIANNSGMNRGTATAGLLANSYNSQVALGNAYKNAFEYNDALRKQVAEFNRGTNQYNSEAKLKADMANQNALAQSRSAMMTGTYQANAMKLAIDDSKGQAISAGLTGIANGLYNLGMLKYYNRLMAWDLQHDPRYYGNKQLLEKDGYQVKYDDFGHPYYAKE